MGARCLEKAVAKGREEVRVGKWANVVLERRVFMSPRLVFTEIYVRVVQLDVKQN